ncbi:flagellar assembly protein FliH [Bacillaceae bacterium IKA-2]|nr:flagellar assembly protein FliH [Bacillaceae bacterium IKA-2]
MIKSFYANNFEKEQKTISLKKVIQEHLTGEELMFGKGKSSIEPRVVIAEDKLQTAIEEADKIKRAASDEYDRFQAKMDEEISDSQQVAEKLYKQAQENGYNEGFQQGLQQGQKEYETLIQDAMNVVTASKNDYIQHLEEAEPIIVELALKVAEKIIADKVAEKSDNWISLVKEVINEVREQSHVKLYIHPNWYDSTLSHKEELRLLLPNCENLYIYPDVHLKENGCTIETPYGKIDASVDSQLTEIKHTLLEKLKEFDGYEGS